MWVLLVPQCAYLCVRPTKATTLKHYSRGCWVFFFRKNPAFYIFGKMARREVGWL